MTGPVFATSLDPRQGILSFFFDKKVFCLSYLNLTEFNEDIYYGIYGADVEKFFRGAEMKLPKQLGLEEQITTGAILKISIIYINF